MCDPFSLIDGGYFTKKVIARPHFITTRQVREICSVSTCLSEAPPDWVDHWIHNHFGWFNTLAEAVGVVPEAERRLYRVFAYRVALLLYRNGTRVAFQAPVDVHPEPVGTDFVSRGFDAVSKSMES